MFWQHKSSHPEIKIHLRFTWHCIVFNYEAMWVAWQSEWQIVQDVHLFLHPNPIPHPPLTFQIGIALFVITPCWNKYLTPKSGSVNWECDNQIVINVIDRNFSKYIMLDKTVKLNIVIYLATLLLRLMSNISEITFENKCLIFEDMKYLHLISGMPHLKCLVYVHYISSYVLM